MSTIATAPSRPARSCEVVARARGGDHDGQGRRARVRLQDRQHGEAVEVRQQLVHHDQVGDPEALEVGPDPPAGRNLHLMIRGLHPPPAALAEQLVLGDDEDPGSMDERAADHGPNARACELTVR
ncbi:MAG TPA: hypothetical protein VNG93_03535 [Candidatus Dormibacteraeota bacterium]|nr:hypothetical protein [Candidatus Dormibacteraeota bacterium]